MILVNENIAETGKGVKIEMENFLHRVPHCGKPLSGQAKVTFSGC